MTRCPKCGGRAGLDLHSVDANGDANASYLCARGEICNFHVYVRLLDWDLPPKPAKTRWKDGKWQPRDMA